MIYQKYLIKQTESSKTDLKIQSKLPKLNKHSNLTKDNLKFIPAELQSFSLRLTRPIFVKKDKVVTFEEPKNIFKLVFSNLERRTKIKQ